MFNALLVFLFYLPFQIALSPGEGVDLASSRVFILLIFLVWLAERMRKKKIIISGNLLTGLISAFLFLNLLSIFVAQNKDWSIRKVLFLFSIFPIYFVSSSLINSEERFLKTLKMLLLGGFLTAILGISQFFLQFSFGLKTVFNFWAKNLAVPFLGRSFSKAVLENPSWLVNISGKTYLRATATFPDPHSFSFFLGLLIPISLGLFLYLREKKFIVIFSTLFLADILTFSRGGYLGLFAGTIFLVPIFWGKIGKKYKLVLGILFFSILLTFLLPGPMNQRLSSSFNLKEGSNMGRMEMWRESLKVALDKPFLGAGIGNYPLVIKPSASYREPINSHNTYLDIASETGIPNMFIWLGIIFLALRIFIKKSQDNSLFIFLAISLIIFSVHALFETAIYSPIILTLFLIIISLANNGKYSQKIC